MEMHAFISVRVDRSLTMSVRGTLHRYATFIRDAIRYRCTLYATRRLRTCQPYTWANKARIAYDLVCVGAGGGRVRVAYLLVGVGADGGCRRVWRAGKVDDRHIPAIGWLCS
jgi:hypothetical protein